MVGLGAPIVLQNLISSSLTMLNWEMIVGVLCAGDDTGRDTMYTPITDLLKKRSK